jgi:hypothetical protein
MCSVDVVSGLGAKVRRFQLSQVLSEPVLAPDALDFSFSEFRNSKGTCPGFEMQCFQMFQ